MSWEYVKFKDICIVNPENIKGNTTEDYQIKYIDIESVNNGIIQDYKLIPFKNAPSRARRIVKSQDILISTVRPYLKAFAKVSDASENLVCSTGFAVLRVNNKILSDYVFLYVMSDFFLNQLLPKMVGASYPAVGPEDIKECVIPMPSIQVQKRVAMVLIEADSLIQKRKQAIAKLDELEDSTFLDLYDKIIGTKDFRMKKLENVIKFITSGSRGWSQYHSDSGELFLTIKNVRDGGLDFSETTYVKPPRNKEAERTRVKENDLLISITADLGRTAVIDQKTAEIGAYINQHLCLLRLDNTFINPYYLSFFLESHLGRKQFMKLDQVGVKSGLNFNAIKSIEICVPSVEIQNEFEAKILEIREYKQLMHTQLQKLEQNFHTLLHQAFTGQLQFATEREKIVVQR